MNFISHFPVYFLPYLDNLHVLRDLASVAFSA